MTKMYKFLRSNDGGKTIKSNSGNHTWVVGERYTIDGRVRICSVGFHASPTPLMALNYVRGEVLALVSGKGTTIKESTKTAFKSMKLLKTYNWTAQDSVDLAVFAAELVLPLFETKHPNDDRPRKAIEAAKNPVVATNAAARAVARAAAYAADNAATDAAAAAANAARATADAAYAAAVAPAVARAVARAADAAASAADAATYAAATYAAASAAAAKLELTSRINEWIVNRSGLDDVQT